MKYLLSFLLFLQIFNLQASKDSTLIYKFDIKEEIGAPVARTTEKSFERAKAMKADYVLIHMNTFGGALDAADKIRSIILNSKIPTVVFVDNNAASAGALISIACDSIYMSPSASMGAASVVNQNGEKMPEKYQSYMRSLMRSTAESHGKYRLIVGKDTLMKWRRDPKLAQSMVDEKVADSNLIVTFTTSEAIKNHFCEGQAESINDVVKLMKVKNYRIVEHKLTAIDNIINFLINPVVSGILILLIMGGLYYEFRTPGFGLPLILAILAAILFFAPHYLEGLAAHWEILVFIVGLILLILEIFVIPGFGIAGITGIVLIFTAFIFSLVDNFSFKHYGFDPDIFKVSLMTVFVTLVCFIVLMIIGGFNIANNPLMKRLALNKTQADQESTVAFGEIEPQNLVGQTGIAESDMRPAGIVSINNKTYDAKADVGYISRGTNIKVIGLDMGQLVVIVNHEFNGSVVQ